MPKPPIIDQGHAPEDPASGVPKDASDVKASHAALAEPKSFGTWLIANEGRLPDDFDLDV